MLLDNRKKEVLHAIVDDYVSTNEPVGSKSLIERHNFQVSSATLRNDMAELEHLGLIEKPHTSAGRIPSDKGYRFYVDTIMERKDKEVTEMKEMMIEKADKMELVLKNLAKVLATNTNYAAMVSAPQYHSSKVKFIQLSQVDETQLLAVIVLEGNIVRNQMIHLTKSLDNETLLKLNILLNTSLNGLTLSEINLGVIAKLKEQAGIHSDIVNEVLDAVAQAIQSEEDLEIYTSGATNIFKYPELSEGSKASELIHTFEEKQQLNELVQETLSNESETGIKVYIGNENSVQSMKDCSVITCTYELDEGMQGTIGIIGPKRMNYEKAVDTLKTLMVQLDTIYKKTYKGA